MPYVKSCKHNKTWGPLLEFSAHDNIAHYIKSSKHKITRILCYSSAYVQFWH